MKSWAFIAILILSAGSLQAEQPRIALADFTVETSSPQFQFVGKGISELISVELLKSKDVVVVEREKRAQLLEEMEFSLSDMADESKASQIGKLLAADYLAFGKAVEMGDQFLFSMKLVKVDTGEQLWADTLMESLSKYNRIAAYLTSSLLKGLKATVASSTERKAEEKGEKKTEALIAFSQAVESFDKNDKKAAKQELVKAKKIDPGNEAVAYYIAKLTAASPKFQVEIDNYATTYNPASFSMIDHDVFYLWQSIALRAGEENTITVGEYALKERESTSRAGVILPLGDRFGLNVEYVGAIANLMISSVLFTPIYAGTNEVNLDNSTNGAYIGLGFRILDTLSVGAAFQGSYTFDTPSNMDTIFEDNSKFNFSTDVGVLYTSPEERFLADVHFVYTTQAETYYVTDIQDIRPGHLPMVVAGTTTAAFFDRRLFASLKGILDIYPADRPGYTVRAIPAFEFWLARFLALRGGYEFIWMDMASQTEIGNGGFGGLTFVLGKWEISGNFTFRRKPIHVLPGYTLPDMMLLVGLQKNETISRFSR